MSLRHSAIAYLLGAVHMEPAKESGCLKECVGTNSDSPLEMSSRVCLLGGAILTYAGPTDCIALRNRSIIWSVQQILHSEVPYESESPAFEGDCASIA